MVQNDPNNGNIWLETIIQNIAGRRRQFFILFMSGRILWSYLYIRLDFCMVRYYFTYMDDMHVYMLHIYTHTYYDKVS